MSEKNTTKTIRIEETVYHELFQGSELRGIPVRLSVDMLGELAICALSTAVREDFDGQVRVVPQSGGRVVKISSGIHDRLEKLVAKIGLNVSTAIHEAFYARRKFFGDLKALKISDMVVCGNACREASARVRASRAAVV